MRKFLNKLFSRLVITAILVVLQLLLLFGGIYYLQDAYVVVAAILRLLTFFAVFYLVWKDINPSIKLAWIVPILMFPLFGGMIYLFYGHIIVPRGLKRNMLDAEEHEKKENLRDKRDVPVSACGNEPVNRLFNYTVNYGKAHIYENEDTKYYSLGDYMYPDLLEDLRGAKEYIFIEFFIINHGVMWDSVLEILKKKVDEGLDVRIIYDDIGSTFYVSKYFYKELEDMGIKCVCFNRIFPFLATILNNRDHRKIVSVDGKVAYTGGINISDEYINVTHPHGHWKDSGIRVCGDAAWEFTLMFLKMWNSVRTTDSKFSEFMPERLEERETQGYIVPFVTNPLAPEPVGENVFMQMINDARKYVYIFTPYLIVGNEMMTALKLVAKRGIDVRIVTPAIPDKKMIYRMTKSAYKDLLKNGVKIYQYTPGFIHSKCILADDELAFVGSINMDNRSFYHHFECGALLYKTHAITDIKKDMMDTFDASAVINLEWCEKNLSRVSILDPILRLISPLL